MSWVDKKKKKKKYLQTPHNGGGIVSGKGPPSYLYSSWEDVALQEKFIKDKIAEGCLIQSLMVWEFSGSVQ